VEVKMRKNRIFAIIALFILAFSLKTFAHPPAKIDLDFDNEEKILKVEIHHPVLFVRNHYIKKIEVYLNDDLKIIQDFDHQLTKKIQKAGYFIFEAEKGDVIKVKANCNKHGDKTARLIVQEKK
jgi:desulfoferrodoxin (superoxide reductase-like protein)